MNSFQLSLCVFGLVLVLGTYSASALSCYVCNSNENYEGKDCNDDTKLEQFLMDCSDYADRYGRPEFKNSTMCRKQEQTVEGDTRIVRSCAIEGRNKCIERTGTKAVKVIYCECEGDGCNSASGVVASLVTVTVAALLSKAFH